MNSIFDFIVEPKESISTSIKNIGDKNLILNTEMQNHDYVSRHGVVTGIPLGIKTDLKIGDEIIIHHNVFRRFYDIRGKEKNSRSYIGDNKYLVSPDQIYAYKRENDWVALEGFCFVKPIVNKKQFSLQKEEPLIGILKYLSEKDNKSKLKINDLVGFAPNSEYEFIIDKQKLYRVPINKITIKYEYQRNEKEYNPSWA